MLGDSSIGALGLYRELGGGGRRRSAAMGGGEEPIGTYRGGDEPIGGGEEPIETYRGLGGAYRNL